MSKNFLKSKSFWSCLVVIVTAVGHMIQTGAISPEDLTTMIAAISAIYGRAVAGGPLTIGSNK